MNLYTTILSWLVISSLGQAAEFAGGTGDPNDPYQIATAEHLLAIGDDPNLLGQCFILVNDIDLDPNRPDGREFDRAVIASGESAFNGVFDGNDGTIRNLTIMGDSRLGLFGQVDREGEVFDLNLVDVVIRGTGSDIGGLVGRNDGWVTGCFCRGEISGSGTVGGLAGQNRGLLRRCSSRGEVSGNGSVGGLAGMHFSGNAYRIIDSCYSTCRVTAMRSVGGLVGYRFGGDVVNSFSTGDVYGEQEVGGLVGESGSSHWRGIARCFSSGDVTGVDAVGGLIGANEGALSHCYSAGLVTGVEDVGGLVGEDISRGMQRASTVNCFWDIETSSVGISSGGIGLTTAQTQDPNTFLAASWDFTDEIVNGNQEIWQMSAEFGYPELRVFYDYEPMRSGGQGTVEDPYLITTAHELACIWFHPDSHYRLDADVDLGGAVFTEAVVPRFGGSLDGNHHLVRNLHILGEDYPEMYWGADGSPNQYLGLVGVLEAGASLYHFGVRDVNVMGSGHYIGALAGRCAGEILGVHSTGQVHGGRMGSRNVGGLVGGLNSGTIIDCWSAADVNGPSRVGGLLGYTSGGLVTRCFSIGTVSGRVSIGGLIGSHGASVLDCYSTAVVTGESSVGGLVGYNGSGRIDNCYSAGLVTGTSEAVGGLVGKFSSGTVSGSFWDADASGQSSSAVGTGRTTEWMMQADTFVRVGWDFEETWWICEGKTYPRFQWEKLICH